MWGNQHERLRRTIMVTRYEPLPTIHLLSISEQRKYEQCGYLEPSVVGVKTYLYLEEGKPMGIQGKRMDIFLPSSIGMMYMYRDRYYDGANCTVFQAFCEFGALRIESFVENILIEVKDIDEKSGFLKTLSKYMNTSLIGHEEFINVSKEDMRAAVCKHPSLVDCIKPSVYDFRKVCNYMDSFEKPEPIVEPPIKTNEVQRFAEAKRITWIERKEEVPVNTPPPPPVSKFKTEQMYMEVSQRDDGLVVKRRFLKKPLHPKERESLEKEWGRHFVVRVRRTFDKLNDIN